MGWITFLLWLACITGIWYAGKLSDSGKIKRYRELKHAIEKRLLPTMVISAVLTIILA